MGGVKSWKKGSQNKTILSSTSFFYIFWILQYSMSLIFFKNITKTAYFSLCIDNILPFFWFFGILTLKLAYTIIAWGKLIWNSLGTHAQMHIHNTHTHTHTHTHAVDFSKNLFSKGRVNPSFVWLLRLIWVIFSSQNLN